ncbi:MAG TPA: chemotaxis protein [Gammaproteobacteria bacterium]|nr:chemotaxis protein [Gammaproteobacteria bacterium]
MAKNKNDKRIEANLLERVEDDFDDNRFEEVVYGEQANSLQDLLDAQAVDAPTELGDLGDIEAQLELARETPTTNASDSKKRNWLIFTAAMFGLAILASFVIVPTVTLENLRKVQVVEISNEVTLTNTAAQQALRPAGSFDLVRRAASNAGDVVNSMVSKDSLTKTLASAIFGRNTTDSKISSAWTDYETQLNGFLATEESVNGFKSQLAEFNAGVNEALNESVSFVEVVAQEGQARTSASDKNRYLALSKEASDLTGILSRLSLSGRAYYDEGSDFAQLSQQQAGLVERLLGTLEQIDGQSGAAVKSLADPLAERFTALRDVVADMGASVSTLSESEATVNGLKEAGSGLLAELASSSQSGLGESAGALSTILPIVFALLGGLGLLRYSQAQTQTIEDRDVGLSQTVARQQDSILKLLDEMSSLADGDLTIEAEVTDQITGAIADSVNFAVIEMRQLVSQINSASLQVAQESQTAVQTANQVSTSNRDQATKITETAQIMNRLAENMRQVSEQAGSSSQMAQESIFAANQGAQAVRDTIRGMEDMREQIQDTSKRIKRLGESSQRIGDIVALIDDIAEQTNILSLNAAIQASMAGEAGRGFAVVSNEVQNLAERSTEATKRIADLVKTIQNDTNDAVASMEKATEQVVAGTRVADTAGAALTEIESVSQRLSDLVGLISTGSNEQAALVTEVSSEVSKVSQTSSETSTKAEEAASSISKLLELSRELETSVSRFKLPAEEQSAV